LNKIQGKLLQCLLVLFISAISIQLFGQGLIISNSPKNPIRENLLLRNPYQYELENFNDTVDSCRFKIETPSDRIRYFQFNPSAHNITCYKDTTLIHYAIKDGYFILPVTGHIKISFDNTAQYTIYRDFKSSQTDTIRIVEVIADANVPFDARYYFNDTLITGKYHLDELMVFEPGIVTIKLTGRGIEPNHSVQIPINEDNLKDKNHSALILYDYKIPHYTSEYPICLWNMKDKYDTNFYGIRTPLSGIGNYHSMNGINVGLILCGYVFIGDGCEVGDIESETFHNGVFLSGLLINTDCMNGLSFSYLLFNMSNRINGIGISCMGVISNHCNGVQLGSISSSVILRGVHVGGIFCTSKIQNGVSIGGLFNNSYSVNGIQMSALNLIGKEFRTYGLSQSTIQYINNHESGINGIQLGVLNISPAVTGVQIGMVNIAKELHGLQIGVVNINKQVPWGFMPIVNLRF
jgi:hypothetical protein